MFDKMLDKFPKGMLITVVGGILGIEYILICLTQGCDNIRLWEPALFMLLFGFVLLSHNWAALCAFAIFTALKLEELLSVLPFLYDEGIAEVRRGVFVLIIIALFYAMIIMFAYLVTMNVWWRRKR